MTGQCLLHDTNLSEIAFTSNGPALVLSFLSMYDGREELRLNCRGLLIVKYHSISSPLPLYVGEVIHEEISAEDTKLRLAHSGYGFTNQDGTVLTLRSERLHFVHLEGGEIDIDIVCTEVAFNRPA